MSARTPALVGMCLDEVETPALIVDLDALESNIATMAQWAQSAGVRLRPHSKTHKSAMLASKQMQAGAVGVCCQKVSEAEALVAAGVSNVLVSNEVWGRSKLDLLASLARQAWIGVCVDDARNVDDVAAAAVRAGSTINVLVEINVGANRCGVEPGKPAVDLARQVAKKRGALRFAGLQAYHGSAQHMRTPEERSTAITTAAEKVRSTLELLREGRLECEIVGGAGTGTYALEGASGLWNELQAGSYVFMDADYARNRNENGGPISTFDHALFVLVTVMSATPGVRSVIDAGHKALGNDSGFPDIWRRPDLRYERPSDEHGVLVPASTGANLPDAGARLLLVPGHCDPTVNLYDWYVGVRGLHGENARVEALWPVTSRGCVI